MNLSLLFIVCLGTIWSILLYHGLLAWGGYRHSLHSEIEKELLDNSSNGDLPFVTVIIPAHNEALVIEKALRSMGKMIYQEGKLEVLCMNDNSTDETGRVARSVASEFKDRIKVIDVPRNRGGRGKSAVLNYALELAKGEVIAVYDADNTPQMTALIYLVRKLMLAGDRAGAIVGKFRTRNKDRNLLTRFINLETIFFQWTTQAGRSHLFNISTIPGTNFIVRKSLMEKLGGWDEMALTEDTELSIRIYMAGYTIEMAPYSVTWEEEPDRWPVWFKQRTRWAMGNLYVVLKYFFPLLFGGFFKLWGEILYLSAIYFLFLTCVTLSLFIFTTGVIGLSYVSMEGPFSLIWALAVVLFVVEMAVCLTNEPGENRGKNLLLAILMYFSYSQMWLLVMFNAVFKTIIRPFRKSKVFWHKTERSEG